MDDYCGSEANTGLAGMVVAVVAGDVYGVWARYFMDGGISES